MKIAAAPHGAAYAKPRRNFFRRGFLSTDMIFKRVFAAEEIQRISIWHMRMAARAAVCVSGVTPAQQALSTAIGISG